MRVKVFLCCGLRQGPRSVSFVLWSSAVYIPLWDERTVNEIERKKEKMHLTAAKKTLRYLESTRNLRLCYGQAPSNDKLKGSILEGFTDSDWVGNEATRKSVGGCVWSSSRVASENTVGSSVIYA
jgi:hypothetical protein